LFLPNLVISWSVYFGTCSEEVGSHVITMMIDMDRKEKELLGISAEIVWRLILDIRYSLFFPET
jgi:hypothetical protein